MPASWWVDRLYRSGPMWAMMWGMAETRSGVDGWRVAAIGLLTPLALLTIQHRGSGVGGDTVAFIASSRDLATPTQFPPGLPLLLAPFPTGLMPCLMVAVTLGLIGVIWWTAVRLGGWRSGALAAGLLMLTPWIYVNGGVVMSDRLGALFLVGALLALVEQRPVLAGVLAACSGVVRLPHVAFLAGLPRRSWVAAGAVVGVLVAFLVLVRGSLFGYTSEQASWALPYIFGDGVLWENVSPATETNLWFYGRLLLGFEGLFAPGAIILAVVGLRRHWGPSARFVAFVAVVNLAILLPYFAQSSRLMLPATALLTVFAAAAAAPARRDRSVGPVEVGEEQANDADLVAGERLDRLLTCARLRATRSRAVDRRGELERRRR